MLTIRREQTRVFESASEQDFRRRLHLHAREVLERASRKMADEDLAAQLNLGLSRGRRFFKTERELARYVEVVLGELGGWDEKADHPEAAIQILRGNAVKPSVRLENFARWVANEKAGRYAK